MKNPIRNLLVFCSLFGLAFGQTCADPSVGNGGGVSRIYQGPNILVTGTTRPTVAVTSAPVFSGPVTASQFNGSGAGLSTVPISALTGVLSLAGGGTGTATPAMIQGSNIVLSGTFPNYTLAVSSTPSFVSITASSATLSGAFTISPQGTATSSSSYFSSAINLQGSSWSGTAAVTNTAFLQAGPSGALYEYSPNNIVLEPNGGNFTFTTTNMTVGSSSYGSTAAVVNGNLTANNLYSNGYLDSRSSSGNTESKMFADVGGQNWIESGNYGFTANSILNLTGYNGNQGSTLNLNFATIKATGTVNISGLTASSFACVDASKNLSGTISNCGILPTSQGGTGTASPGIIQGLNMNVTGTFPTQTVATVASPAFTGVNISGLTQSMAVCTDTLKNLISCVPGVLASGNNVWTGTNQFNQTVTLGPTNTATVSNNYPSNNLSFANSIWNTGTSSAASNQYTLSVDSSNNLNYTYNGSQIASLASTGVITSNGLNYPSSGTSTATNNYGAAGSLVFNGSFYNSTPHAISETLSFNPLTTGSGTNGLALTGSDGSFTEFSISGLRPAFNFNSTQQTTAQWSIIEGDTGGFTSGDLVFFDRNNSAQMLELEPTDAIFNGPVFGTAFVNNSRRILKHDITSLMNIDALYLLEHTCWSSYKYKIGPQDVHYGFIADCTPSILSKNHMAFDAETVSTFDGMAIVQEDMKVKTLQKQVATLQHEIATLRHSSTGHTIFWYWFHPWVEVGS